jgi:hypothetical protein
MREMENKNRSFLLFFGFLSLFSLAKSVTSEEYAEYAKNMTALDEKMLQPAIMGNSTLVLFLNGDFSDECRRAMKGFAIAAQRLKKKQLPSDMAYVDCKKYVTLCEEVLQTTSYPTVKYIVRKKLVNIPLKGRTQKLVVQSVIDYIKSAGEEITREGL